jgi:hypothetical protein
LFLSVWLALGVAWAADPVVSRVTVKQRPGTKLVEIGDDLAAAQPVEIGIRLSANHGASRTAAVRGENGDQT